jgi:hypothetical protein
MDTKERMESVDSLLAEAEGFGEAAVPGWAKEPFGMMKKGLPAWSPPPKTSSKEKLPNVPGVSWEHWLTKAHFKQPKKGDKVIINGAKWVIEKVIARGWMTTGELKGKKLGAPAWAAAVKRPRGKKMMAVRMMRLPKHPGSFRAMPVIDVYTGSRVDNSPSTYFKNTF